MTGPPPPQRVLRNPLDRFAFNFFRGNEDPSWIRCRVAHARDIDSLAFFRRRDAVDSFIDKGVNVFRPDNRDTLITAYYDSRQISVTEETISFSLYRASFSRFFVLSISDPMVLLLCPSGTFSGNDEYAFGRASTLSTLEEEEREEEQWASWV